MESSDKMCYYPYDEQFSSIFNGNIPSLVIKIEISQIPQSPLQNTDCLQEVNIESASTVSRKEEKSIYAEDIQNAVDKVERQIYAPQISESLLQDDDSLQDVSVESLSTIQQKEKVSISEENPTDGVKEIKLRTDASQIPQSLLQNTDCLQEVNIESASIVSGKEKKPISTEDIPNAVNKVARQIYAPQISGSLLKNEDSLQDVSFECLPTMQQKEKVSISEENPTDGVKEIKLKTNKSQVVQSPPLNTECLKEVHDESVPDSSGKGKRPIFNENFPNTVKKIRLIGANQIPELLPQDDESLPEVFIESAPILSQKGKKPIPDENFSNAEEEIKLQIDASQKPDSLPPNSEYLKKVLAESVPSISRTAKRPNPDEVFPIAVKRMKREIDVNQISELPTKDDKSLQEVSIQSVPTILQKGKNPIPDKNDANFMKEIKLQIGASQIPELTSQNNKYLKEVSIESSVSEMKKRPNPDEDFPNAVKRIKREVWTNQIPELPTKDGKRLQEVLIESAPTTSRKKIRRNPDKDFKNVLKKIQRQRNSKVSVTSSAVEIMNELICHFIEHFDEELNILKKIRKVKTLTVKQMEYVTKLCLPQVLHSSAMIYGRLAVQSALKKTE